MVGGIRVNWAFRPRQAGGRGADSLSLSRSSFFKLLSLVLFCFEINARLTNINNNNHSKPSKNQQLKTTISTTTTTTTTSTTILTNIKQNKQQHQFPNWNSRRDGGGG
jgi:hypothetical protein